MRVADKKGSRGQPDLIKREYTLSVRRGLREESEYLKACE